MVKVIISADSRYKINRTAIQGAVLSVLQRNNVRGQVEIEVNIVGDRKMHELNKKYRNLDYPTDILTFALEDPNPTYLSTEKRQLLGGVASKPFGGFIAAPDKILRLGSIIISHPQAVEDATLDSVPVEDEICYLVEHGTDHLLGFHHN